MEIRDLSIHDLTILEREAKFPMPNLVSGLYPIKKSIDEDRLLASFWVKVTTETSLILRPDLSDLTKAKIIIKIFKFLTKELQRLGFDDSHLFIENDESYVKFLKQYFSFRDNLGHALYIRAEDANAMKERLEEING